MLELLLLLPAPGLNESEGGIAIYLLLALWLSGSIFIKFDLTIAITIKKPFKI